MYQKVVQSIVTIVNIVNPQNIVYIAIDGPCPKQKMHQQRLRRFKSSKENKMRIQMQLHLEQNLWKI